MIWIKSQTVAALVKDTKLLRIFFCRWIVTKFTTVLLFSCKAQFAMMNMYLLLTPVRLSSCIKNDAGPFMHVRFR